MNVINDNWLFVRYLNDEVKQISVRQAFIDADKIKNIETPTFHNVKVYIYDVPVIQFLSIIVLATYFKSETKFKAGTKYFSKNLINDGLDTNLIINYLDKWQDRFNIDDKQYPFLQDIRLSSILDYENTNPIKYVSKINLIIPGSWSPIFEHNTNNESIKIENYDPSLDEFIYILLYLGTMGTSINADNYPGKTLNANCTLFAVNYGKTLQETIINNCLPLENSNDDENDYDRPIWEFNNRDDILKYDFSKIGSNTLMCSFFPSLPMLAAIKNNKVVDFVWANRKHPEESKCIINKDLRESISLVYTNNNPWAIRHEILDENKEKVVRYKNWNNNLKMINLCIDITKHLPTGDACKIISSEYQADKCSKTIIYYREYDSMKCNVISFGKYEFDTDILRILENKDHNDKALIFQTILDIIQKRMNDFYNVGITKFNVNACKLRFSKFAENYFFNTYVYNIDTDTIIYDSVDILIKQAKLLMRNLEQSLTNPLIYAQTYKKFCGNLNKLREEYNTNE